MKSGSRRVVQRLKRLLAMCHKSLAMVRQRTLGTVSEDCLLVARRHRLTNLVGTVRHNLPATVSRASRPLPTPGGPPIPEAPAAAIVTTPVEPASGHHSGTMYRAPPRPPPAEHLAQQVLHQPPPGPPPVQQQQQPIPPQVVQQQQLQQQQYMPPPSHAPPPQAQDHLLDEEEDGMLENVIVPAIASVSHTF